jgi:YD repeat-containing protein
MTVTIAGSNFGTSGTVTFNGITATPTSWSANSIVTAVPAGASTGSVIVTVGTSGSNSYNFTVNNGPVTYVYDDLGRLVGVIDVLGNAATYSYDAVGNILSITRLSPNQVSIIKLSPTSGAVGAGVTIYGTGFSSNASQDAVTFNGTTATITSASTTQLQVTVPVGATSGSVSVTSPNGTATSSGSFTVTAGGSAPTITSFSPTSGLAGTAVNIVGTNFDPTLANNKLRLNITSAGVTSVTSSTNLVGTIPSNAASGRLSLITPTGKAVSSQDFYVPFESHTVADIGFTGRITMGGSQLVTLGSGGNGKIGMLLFDGVAGQNISIQLSGSTYSYCLLYLEAPDNTRVYYYSCSATTTSIPSVTLTKDGTYTIGIDPGTNSAGSINIGLTGAGRLCP